MAFRKTTLRHLPKESRKLARLINDLDSVVTRLKNYLPIIEEIEHDSITLYSQLSTFEKKMYQQHKAELELPDQALANQQEIPYTDGSHTQPDRPLFDQTIKDKAIQDHIDELKANTLKADLEMAQSQEHKEP
jgi:hypothetical protein